MSDLLPPNATAQERALSIAVDRAIATPLREVWNPDTCPESLLGWLAWAFSVDEWNPTWSNAQKREVIKASVSVHRYKGTVGAVQEGVGALFVGARVQEWFNQIPSGDPYTFRVLLEVNQVGAEQAAYASLLRVIDRAKNTRSHLDRIDLTVKSQTSSSPAAAAGVGNEITLRFGPTALLNPGVIVAPDSAVVNAAIIIGY